MLPAIDAILSIDAFSLYLIVVVAELAVVLFFCFA
jgi:hypothetical protein